MAWKTPGFLLGVFLLHVMCFMLHGVCLLYGIINLRLQIYLNKGMPRSTIKKTAQPQLLRHDPVVWGISGAYLVGMLMVGAIAAMTNLSSFKAGVSYSV